MGWLDGKPILAFLEDMLLPADPCLLNHSITCRTRKLLLVAKRQNHMHTIGSVQAEAVVELDDNLDLSSVCEEMEFL